MQHYYRSGERACIWMRLKTKCAAYLGCIFGHHWRMLPKNAARDHTLQ